MKKTSITSILCTLAAAVAVATGVILTVHLAPRAGQPAAAPVIIDAGPPTSRARPPTADRPEPTVSPTMTTSPTTAPPTTVSPTTTAPPTTSSTPPTSVPPEPTPPDAAATLRPGDRGPAVLELQQRLRQLGYWLGAADGTYGRLLEQAVMAFQKVEGLSPDGVAGPATRAALAVAERPSTSSSEGDLIEVDKNRQVLFVVRDGQVAWVLNTSTGTEQPYQVGGRTEMADTPSGRWTVSWAVDGNDIGPLGALYRPRYFHRDGIAVHGYHSVPAYPASHGCVRVTEAAMDWIWAHDLMPLGSVVWVH